MYDIDLFNNDAATVSALHEDGRIVICYMNAGGWENWRSDAAKFPEEIIGKNLDGWEGERWLDIRRLDVLAPIMEDQMIACKNKGFDGIEPDNVDGYLNDTGFDLTATDQLEFNIWLAETFQQLRWRQRRLACVWASHYPGSSRQILRTQPQVASFQEQLTSENTMASQYWMLAKTRR